MLNEAVFALSATDGVVKLANKHHPYTNQFKINRNLVLLSPTSTGPPCVPPWAFSPRYTGARVGRP